MLGLMAAVLRLKLAGAAFKLFSACVHTTHTYTHAHTHSLTHSRARAHSLSLSLAHTHTHKHTQGERLTSRKQATPHEKKRYDLALHPRRSSR